MHSGPSGVASRCMGTTLIEIWGWKAWIWGLALSIQLIVSCVTLGKWLSYSGLISTSVKGRYNKNTHLRIWEKNRALGGEQKATNEEKKEEMLPSHHLKMHHSLDISLQSVHLLEVVEDRSCESPSCSHTSWVLGKCLILVCGLGQVMCPLCASVSSL